MSLVISENETVPGELRAAEGVFESCLDSANVEFMLDLQHHYDFLESASHGSGTLFLRTLGEWIMSTHRAKIQALEAIVSAGHR
jgi:hypothetical protein